MNVMPLGKTWTYVSLVCLPQWKMKITVTLSNCEKCWSEWTWKTCESKLTHAITSSTAAANWRRWALRTRILTASPSGRTCQTCFLLLLFPYLNFSAFPAFLHPLSFYCIIYICFYMECIVIKLSRLLLCFHFSSFSFFLFQSAGDVWSQEEWVHGWATEEGRRNEANVRPES